MIQFLRYSLDYGHCSTNLSNTCVQIYLPTHTHRVVRLGNGSIRITTLRLHQTSNKSLT